MFRMVTINDIDIFNDLHEHIYPCKRLLCNSGIIPFDLHEMLLEGILVNPQRFQR
jgi:hypothetical protein